jgi:hypothetical protein
MRRGWGDGVQEEECFPGAVRVGRRDFRRDELFHVDPFLGRRGARSPRGQGRGGRASKRNHPSQRGRLFAGLMIVLPSRDGLSLTRFRVVPISRGALECNAGGPLCNLLSPSLRMGLEPDIGQDVSEGPGIESGGAPHGRTAGEHDPDRRGWPGWCESAPRLGTLTLAR